MKDNSKKPKTFITSDLHLDHENIIKFCKRPFINVKDMNKTLVNNWNKIIGKKDVVYYLGDFVYNFELKKNPDKHKERFQYWSNILNGKKIFIRGNHDPTNIKLEENLILKYDKYLFFLCHEPEQVLKNWKGWVIFGHHHNHKLEEYPFMDKKNKRINVSTELTNYKPVDMDKLIQLIEDKHKKQKI